MGDDHPLTGFAIAGSCVLALAVGVCVWHLTGDLSGVRTVDLLDQSQIAGHLAEGHGIGTSVVRPPDVAGARELGPVSDRYHAPVVPLLLASVFALWKCDDSAVGVALAGVHLALSLTLFLVGARLFGAATGLLAATLWAAGWRPLQLDFSSLQSSVVALLLLLVVCAVAGGTESAGGPSADSGSGQAVPWFRLGLLAGLCSVTQYSAALIGVILPTWCVVSQRRQRWRRVGALAAGMAICLLPWGVRNARVSGNPFGTMARLQLVSDTSRFPGSSVLREEGAVSTSVVGFLIQHPRAVLRKVLRSWRRLIEFGVPGLGFVPGALFVSAALVGFEGRLPRRVTQWTLALLICGLTAVGLTGSSMALLPAVMPLVTLLGSHHLRCVVRARVGDDP